MLIKFKSDDEYFNMEKSDIKNNTVRRIPKNDERHITLEKYCQSDFEDELVIQIMNTRDREFFVRNVRHAVKYLGLWIITWDETC